MKAMSTQLKFYFKKYLIVFNYCIVSKLLSNYTGSLGAAYGVYVAHIEAPGIGEKLLKFAIIK
jgi:hypothetical protein